MKHKLFFLLLAIIVGAGTMDAEKVQVGDLYYNLSAEDSTAEVTSSPDGYAGSITIPATIDYGNLVYTVTSIGSSAFSGCSDLTYIGIPNTIKSIGHYGFAACRGLTSITIPSSVTDIGQSAFYNCEGFPIIDNLRYADTYLIEAIDKTLTSYSVREGTRWLGDMSFSNCSNMISVDLPSSLHYIEYGVFYMCPSLASITIPINVELIDIYAFAGCTSLLSVTFNARNCDNGKTLGGHAQTLFGSSVESIVFGNEVESIPELCCYSMNKLTSVSIPTSVTKIGTGAFMYCTSLTTVDIPNSVISIGGSAFYGCTDLTSVVIGRNVKECDYTVFMNCANIKSVVWNAINCDMPQVAYFGTQVESFAFGDDVETIPDYCCQNMEKLTAICIPSKVKVIGKTAFLGCSGITEMDIPNSVTDIGQWSFWGCSNMTSIRIGSGVKNIGGYTFNGCSGLKSITCDAVVPPVCDMGVFYYVDKSIPLYVPRESIDAYKDAPYWTEFYNVKAIGTELIEIISDNQVINDKVLYNGQVYFIKGDRVYTMQGQLVE